MTGCFVQKRIVFPDPLKQGLRVEFLKIEGLFCKSDDDVRPEALRALLVGKDMVGELDADTEICPVRAVCGGASPTPPKR